MTALGAAASCGLSLALALPGGCGSTCGDYVECPTRAGLRYVECAEDRHEFNDGTTIESTQEGVDYCYCNTSVLTCIDGSKATMCNTTNLDGSPTLFVDNSGAPLTSGVASCLGYDICTIENDGCEYAGWYLRCMDDTTTRYVGSNGATTTDVSVVMSGCTVAGAEYQSPDPYGSGGGGSGTCVDAIDSCSELYGCTESVACYSAVLEECRDAPDCFYNDDETSCDDDPACEWSV